MLYISLEILYTLGFSNKGQTSPNVIHVLPRTKYLKKSYTTLTQVWVYLFFYQVIQDI